MSCCPTRNNEFALETFEDEAILYNMGSEKILHLNGTAALVWGLCDGERSTEDITKLLAEAYPGDVGIRDDVNAAIEDLTREHALT